jgi:hypothetical protein
LLDRETVLQEAAMRSVILPAILLLAVWPAYAQETGRHEAKEFLYISDKYYWAGAEGNLGIEINGKFGSEAALITTLSLSTEIGPFKDRHYPFDERKWTLRDILVSVDFNGGGSVAKWQVSGPKPLLLSYLDGLKKKSEDKSSFYDFGYRFMTFKPSAD